MHVELEPILSHFQGSVSIILRSEVWAWLKGKSVLEDVIGNRPDHFPFPLMLTRICANICN